MMATQDNTQPGINGEGAPGVGSPGDPSAGLAASAGVTPGSGLPETEVKRKRGRPPGPSKKKLVGVLMDRFA